MRGRDRAGGRGAALVLGVALLAGCSGASGGPTPTATVETFMRALGNRDVATACSVVSSGGSRLSGASLDQCKEGLQKVLAGLGNDAELAKLRSATVTGASVNGDKATVAADQIVDVPPGYQNSIDLVRIDGAWYIDSKTA